MIQVIDDAAGKALANDMESTQAAFETLKGLSFNDALSKIANGMVEFAFKLILAALVFYIGKFIIRRLYKFTRTVMVGRRVDASLTSFVLSLIKMVLYFILIITVIGILGIETSSFLALFASAGVAIGMALSGTLQNFAGGVLLLLLKPYKVGDYIEAQGFSGTVKEIQIFHTVINTPDNKAIIIPNGGLSTSSINNYSLESYRRVDWTVGLSYGDDFDRAADVIKEMLLSDSRVVVQYVEDDIARRIEAEEEAHLGSLEEECEEHPDSEACEELDKSLHPEKINESGIRNLWGRIFHHRKKVAAAAQEKVLSRIAPNADMPKIDRSPFVGLGELADSSINITVRAWTHTSNYWGLYFDMNRRFYNELPQHGFNFPFPQLDVHLQQPS